MQDRLELDIAPLASAVERLHEGLARHRGEPADEQIRDGLIQRFEYTYELSHRFMRRFIRMTAASPADIDQMPFQDLIRTANQHGLLRGDWPAWHRFRDLRARTSHTYHAETAALVASEIPSFLDEAAYLCSQLRARLP